MKTPNIKYLAFASSLTFVAMSAFANDHKTQTWNVGDLLGTGSTFQLGTIIKDKKKVDDEVVVPQGGETLFFSGGKQLENVNSKETKGKDVCMVQLKNTLGRPAAWGRSTLTILNPPSDNTTDSQFKNFEDIPLDLSTQIDPGGTSYLDPSGAPSATFKGIAVVKVACTKPLANQGRSNLTMEDLAHAFGKQYGSFDPNLLVYTPGKAPAPAAPPVSDNGDKPTQPTTGPGTPPPSSGGTAPSAPTPNPAGNTASATSPQ